ncbi:MAG: DJ-1/PfpI family protein [Fluviicola sp.]
MKFAIALFSILLMASCSSETAPEPKSKPSITLEKGNYNVAFLITDGTYNTEFTAPWDIFDHVRFRNVDKGMNLFTVSNTNRPITTFEGLKISPDFNFLVDSIPHIDILVIPSAEHHLDTDLQDKKLVAFVKKTSEKATWVATHCDGAFLLAKTGLLDEKHCTTFPSDIKAMSEMFNKPIVEDGVLFVHDGKYITSVGGAKSFEASLYLCELLYGSENARDLAEGLVIDWDLSRISWKYATEEH